MIYKNSLCSIMLDYLCISILALYLNETEQKESLFNSEAACESQTFHVNNKWLLLQKQISKAVLATGDMEEVKKKTINV